MGTNQLSIKKRRRTATSIIEIIIAIAIFSIIASGIVIAGLGSFSGLKRSEEGLGAAMYAVEGIEAMRSMRDYDWTQLAAGTYGLSDSDGYWKFSGGSDTSGQYTRTVSVADRDAAIKDITATVSWPGAAAAVTLKNTLTRWKGNFWLQTLLAHFDAGQKNSIAASAAGDGEFSLAPQPNFSQSSVFNRFNFSGSGDINDLFVTGNTLYIILTNDDADEGFVAFDISDISNGALAKIGAAPLNVAAKSLAVNNGYAYISSSDNTKEIIIVRLSDFARINTIDIPTGANANGIVASDSTLYVTTTKSSQKEFYSYDISNPESAITQIAAAEFNADAQDVFIENGYAYLATGDDGGELKIMRLSDFNTVNSADIPGNADATAINRIGNNVYVSTGSNSAGAEFYAYSIPSPEGAISLAGSIDIGNDITTFYVQNETAYATTHAGGAEELRILNLNNYTVQGAIDLSGGPNADAVWLYGSYLYVGTSNNSDTLQIIQGDTSAGGGGGGASYVSLGIFTSQPLDTGWDTTVYGQLAWTSSGTGTIKFQLRTASTEAALGGSAWTGPDGTANTYYITSGTQIMAAPGAGKRWAQYQTTLEGPGTDTPVIKDVTVNY